MLEGIGYVFQYLNTALVLNWSQELRNFGTEQ